MSTSALMLLLVPHGLTAVVSVFTISALMEARRDSLVIQSIKALEVMGRVTSICIDKNSFLSSGPKRLASPLVCVCVCVCESAWRLHYCRFKGMYFVSIYFFLEQGGRPRRTFCLFLCSFIFFLPQAMAHICGVPFNGFSEVL